MTTTKTQPFTFAGGCPHGYTTVWTAYESRSIPADCAPRHRQPPPARMGTGHRPTTGDPVTAPADDVRIKPNMRLMWDDQGDNKRKRPQAIGVSAPARGLTPSSELSREGLGVKPTRALLRLAPHPRERAGWWCR